MNLRAHAALSLSAANTASSYRLVWFRTSAAMMYGEVYSGSSACTGGTYAQT